MSEAAPGYPDAPAFATQARARLADAVRDLIEAVMTTPEASAAELAEATEAAERATTALTHGALLQNVSGYRARSHLDHLPRSPVVGEASPLSPRIEWEVVDGGIRARGTFGAVYEGPPGFVHGGMIALAFDEMLGLANVAAGQPGLTGTLTVRYRRPTPLFTELRFEARVVRVEGRRIVSTARLWAGETLCAEAEGLFIQPRPELVAEYFGHLGEPPEPAG